MTQLSRRGAIACIFMFVTIMLANHYSNAANVGIILPKSQAPTSILSQGDIVLHWTATGDDGRFGRARYYDVRYLPATQGPIDNETRWNQAVQIGGPPIPSAPGRPDSMHISGFLPGAGYYFAIKVIDESGCCSALSNSPLLYAEQGDWIAGDANNSGTVDGLDMVYLLNYFRGGGPPPPDPQLRADCNGNCEVNGVDAVYLVLFLRGDGDPPVRGNCLLAHPPELPKRDNQNR
jgi:hypothetical protein